MNSKKKEYTRRDAVGLIGKGVAAAAVTSAVLGTAKEVKAQGAVNLEFVIKDYRAYMQSAPQFQWTTQIIVRSGDFTKQCTLYFWKDEANLPANTVAADGLSGAMYYPESRLAEIRDFMRYERPIRLTIVAGNGIGTLANDADEKPGDHDLRLSRLVNNTP
ncbi:MAG: hypothetical protein HKN33_15905 [Pyrinomonadaceae bacterium]|nr:hypothetical protein [Pyrinomonadaceae bacterium]